VREVHVSGNSKRSPLRMFSKELITLHDAPHDLDGFGVGHPASNRAGLFGELSPPPSSFPVCWHLAPSR